MADMRLVVAGAGGRMGRTLIRAIAETKGLGLAETQASWPVLARMASWSQSIRLRSWRMRMGSLTSPFRPRR
jgi:dihydrodipicolinate reductase